MEDTKKLKEIFMNGSKTEKLEVLECLKDQFDSFDKNLDDFSEKMNLLVGSSIRESDIEVKIEMFEALSKAATFQNIEDIDFDEFIENLEIIPEECLSRSIDILSFTHKKKYLSVIKKYLTHRNPYVRESAKFAIDEMSGVV